MLNANEKLVAYRFEGYWKDVGTIESLWEANMDLLSPKSGLNLSDDTWKIYGRNNGAPPHFTSKQSKVTHSLVSEGCEIYGEVSESILFSDVTIEKGAKVEYSILMPGAVVEKGASVRYAIVAENAHICAGASGRRRAERSRRRRTGASPSSRPACASARTQSSAPRRWRARTCPTRNRKEGIKTMKNVLGLIIAFDTDNDLRELTDHRSVAAVPFGGRYRIVDFMLSNMANAGIFRIGLLMKDKYQSLIDHIGTGKDWDLSP